MKVPLRNSHGFGSNVFSLSLSLSLSLALSFTAFGQYWYVRSGILPRVSERCEDFVRALAEVRGWAVQPGHGPNLQRQLRGMCAGPVQRPGWQFPLPPCSQNKAKMLFLRFPSFLMVCLWVFLWVPSLLFFFWFFAFLVSLGFPFFLEPCLAFVRRLRSDPIRSDPRRAVGRLQPPGLRTLRAGAVEL